MSQFITASSVGGTVWWSRVAIIRLQPDDQGGFMQAGVADTLPCLFRSWQRWAAPTAITPASAIASSVLLPFCVAFFLIGLVEFAQHTHPRVPWTKEVADRAFYDRPELASVHLETPAWLGYALMNILDHPVHHLLPKIPCYRLRAAQSDLNQRLGGEAVRARFGLGWYVDTMKTCKLYDFEVRRWVAFGAATSAATLVGDEFAV
ncbi:MAG: fatty acid desaturase [Comamonadaceae bacterium]|nr:fatty acid desaturase [Comamonadaceae bacterium]